MALPILPKHSLVQNLNHLTHEHVATRLPIDDALRQNNLPPQVEERCRAAQISGQAVAQVLLGVGVAPDGISMEHGVQAPCPRRRSSAEWMAIAIWVGFAAARSQSKLKNMSSRFKLADEQAQKLLGGQSGWSSYLASFSAQCRLNGARFQMEHAELITDVAAELIIHGKLSLEELERLCVGGSRR